ncbi:ORF34 [black bullhead herpesvirus]|uniref:ORF34 n=1 Tax=black bullhead herpesvirus TaxID=508441 RepID=A0A2H5AJH8_9VIRU|nr:ORF34 [black bullhead herpesvirus]AUG72287.1 ORF34 [black bullhead herpesvirus]
MEQILRQLLIGSCGVQPSGGIGEHILEWGRTKNSGTSTVAGWTPPPPSFLMSNTILRIHTSEPAFFIHVKHVNTVTNRQHMVRTVGRGHHKTIQSNIIKRGAARFVTDKKKLGNLFGAKSTRIEFTTGDHRSANYTANCKPLIQPVYKSYFNLIMKSHGEYSVGSHRDVINNLNYTTYLYGVQNPMTTMIESTKKKDFLTPFFFSSINLMGPVKTTNQLFISMTINTQRLTHETIGDLGQTLYPIYSLLEVDVKLNWFCNMMVLYFGGFLNTPNKIIILWANESYYIDHPHENGLRGPETWLQYRAYMLPKCAPHFNGFSMAFAQRTGQFRYKNCEMVHLAPLLLTTDLMPLVMSYGAHLIEARKVASFKELVVMISTNPGEKITIQQTPEKTVIVHDGRQLIEWHHGASFKVERAERIVLRKKINQYIKCKSADTEAAE